MTLVAVSILATACGRGGHGENSFTTSSEKISLLAASEHIEEFASDCLVLEGMGILKHDDGENPGHGKGKNSKGIASGSQCVTICHVPPGNPANSKSLMIPLTAVAAHLNHGGPNHDEHDFIGTCEAGEDDGSDDGTGDVPGAGDGGGTVDEGGTDGGSDGGSDTGDGGFTYCDPIMMNDLDCDGIDDSTGEPLF